MMTKKTLLPVLLVPTFLLVIPLVANFTVEGFNWNPGAFVFLWLVMVAIGVAYKLATHGAGSNAQRLAMVIALGTGFLIFWGNLAVGFIGSDDNPVNLLYLVVLALGAIGAVRVRFATAGMARTMWMMTGGILLVPVVALIVRPHDFSPGVPHVFLLNAVFALMFAVAGFLFRNAAGKRGEEPAALTT